VKLERWQEAVDALRRTLGLNPDYTSAYQMLGTALENLGQRDAARVAWTEGVEVATRTGAWKAREHMERLLAGVTDSGASGGLCAE
jgi:predicted Zn-dependent protease